MFEHLEPAPPDAILGLTEAFRADPNPRKVNLTVGVYRDERGVTPVLECVTEAERRLAAAAGDKTYLPIDGLPDYARHVRELSFGADHEIVASGRSSAVQAPGGTGALRVGAEFLRQAFPKARVWVSTPTWPNHPGVFQAAGLAVESYPYYDAATGGVDFEALLDGLRAIPAGDIVCLHPCCHNPTGADPAPQEWRQIADAVYERGLVPLLDFAYQGFGDGVREDARGLEAFCRPQAEFLVCSSFSKNFGLYRERVGALVVVTKDAPTAAVVSSRLKRVVRVNYSNPPSHGAAVVSEILSDAGLRREWELELGGMRNRINGMRTLFARTLTEKSGRDFSFIERGRGMFSLTGLSPEQVDRLRIEQAIYIVRDSRVNVAGMTSDTMDDLCERIASVL
ncbi:MAG: aspartate/tyrosine/aromatic aminotransferase [Planctomycetes bacterium]|nr:aspartate/tyrosine/aromatic aminotransferase [Planctomycetota bacterium]